ncbi:nicotinate-nucleotide adenylyltransferase [Listeria sp. PSOL-1]|uniref:nicotinate-nucleotide adenylyltransferase n=1 Tax=Listeria sp. PSOL-1 TaxID=1844999 RepID=UPI0013D8252A|nr:nicotinate-nucleotide adenylyltransferase [Listeria sp. PSOL-1]
MKKKIGILGGTFNPPHIMHLIIANEVRNKLGLQKIIFLPNNQPPHKETTVLASNEERLAMLQLAIKGNPYFEIDPRELHRKGKSYTFDTMKEMVAEEPETLFYFIIGGDMVEYLPKWYHVNELVQLVQFVGVNRPNYLKQSAFDVLWVDVPETAICSTLIRRKIAANKPIDYYTPAEVVQYIKEHKCYETN